MPRAVQTMIALALPLVLAAGGCMGTRSPAFAPTGVSRPIKRPLPATTPRALPTATNSFQLPTPTPSEAAPTTVPTATPRPSPTPIAKLPPVLGQPVALNPDVVSGFTSETRNYLVLGVAGEPPGSFKLAFSSETSTAAGEAAYRTLSSSPGDFHTAMRRFEAERLQGAPAPRYTVQQAAGPLSRGQELPFYVITGFDTANYEDVKITARLEEVGEHCYVFVDKDLSPSDAPKMAQRAKEIAQVFDSRIHPTNTRLFGSEPRPGVDGDPRVVILISPAVGNYGQDNTLGFFSQRDAYKPEADPRPIFKHSNAREMIYVSSRIVLTGAADDYLGTIAHEFQHMINFNQKVLVGKNTQSDDLWIDEGMAMYAIEANGYGLKQGGSVLANHVRRFQLEPDAFSLTDWKGNPDGIGYGPVYLFMVYLADRFSETVIRDIVTSAGIGVENLDKVLSGRGTNFERVFHDWAMANWIDGRTLGGSPHHHYQSLTMIGYNGKTKLNGFQAQALEAAGAVSPTLRPHTIRYYELPRGPERPRFTLTPSASADLFPRLVLP